MITVNEALDALFSLARPLPTESVPLVRTAGRVLRQDAIAQRAQPPFAASAMDGYAARARDLAVGKRLKIIGEAPAGKAFSAPLGPEEAVRIFTGAPIPKGADTVVIQENTERQGDHVLLTSVPGSETNIRPSGGDFLPGDRISAPRWLRPNHVALAAAMNLPMLTVTRRPVVAILATGNELVMPGEAPAEDQIVASNSFGLKALLEEAGADVRMLPIARDTLDSLRTAFSLATGADMVITIGGASVGDHDLVAEAAGGVGLDRAFYKVAMRPGKPLMAGRLGDALMIGLPGNPVSAMVCGHIFVLPTLRAILGLPAEPAPRRSARLAIDIGPNGPREHYMRAKTDLQGALSPFGRQDSSLLTVLAEADALVVRPVADGPRKAGDMVEYLPI